MPPRISAPLLVATLLFAGCGGDAEPRVTVTPVAGTILQGGKPFAKARIRFHPVNPPAGAKAEDPAAAISVAEADDAGKYVLSTYTAGDGVPAGDYVVTIEAAAGPSVEDADVPVPVVRPAPTLAKYAKKETSPLKATIKPGENPPLDFDLK